MKLKKIIAILLFAFLLLTAQFAVAASPADFRQEVRSRNTSDFLPNRKTGGRDWWAWTIFLTGPEYLLRQIQCVKYTLHPTYSQPVQIVCKRGLENRAFEYTSIAYGTFEVGIALIMKEGSEQKIIELEDHSLAFQNPTRALDD